MNKQDKAFFAYFRKQREKKKKSKENKELKQENSRYNQREIMSDDLIKHKDYLNDGILVVAVNH